MKKFMCIISVCLIFVSLFSFSAFANNGYTPSIFMTTTNATPGDTIEVNVFLKNNPGIVSAKLNFNFDEKLTLIEAINGDAFSTLTYIPPKQLSNGVSIKNSCQFAWQGFDIDDKDITDGKIITLVFAVSENAQIDETLKISISTTQGNVVDKNLNRIMLSAEKNIKVLDYLPGDVNGDGNINMLDTVSISRYIVDNKVTDPNGYNITLNERAANVNDDSSINMLDVVLLCRYIVDGCETIPEPNGYNVELLPQTEKCLHELTKTNAKPATCTTNGNIAYWYCSKCHNYYKNSAATIEITIAETITNAHGHTEVIDVAVAPTYSSTGLTEGKHCSTCNIVLVPQQSVPALVPVRHSVSYTNVKTADISSYPTTFTEHEGLDLNSLVPTAQGYTFEGWYVGSNRLTTIPVGTTSNIVLTARWTANNYEISLEDIKEIKKDISVTFSKNFSGSTPIVVTLENGDILPYPTNPTRSGYIFTGWYTTSDCTTKYNFNGTITNDMTLYAGWTTNGYTVSNNSSSRWSVSGNTLTSTNKSHSSSSEYRITASIPLVVSFNYKTSSESNFDYLYIKKNGSTLKSCSGSTSYASYSVSLNTGDYLSFIYSKDGSASDGSDAAYISNLTYSPNISYSSTATATCTGTDGYIYDEGSSYITNCDYGDSFTLPVPTRTGCTFEGWYDGVGGTGTRYTNAQGESTRNWDKAQKTTLYPKWTISTFALTLDNQGGTGSTSVTVTYGEAMPRLTAPTKTGYTFTGYYDAVTGGTKYYNADMTSARSWTLDETATLYARWTANTYTITLNNQGGTGSSSVTATYGSSLPTLTAPTKAGHRFLGYFTATTGGTQYYSSTMVSQVTWNSTRPITLYARWEAIEYTITFNANQGTGAQTAVTVTYGSNMSPITVAPTRPGYVFTGYYDAVTGGTKYYNADLSSAKTWDKEANTVLYAHWQANPYTVRFNANGGTGTMANQTFEYGTSENLNRNTFTRTGYTFAGWNTAANGTGTTYANEASVLNLTSVANTTIVLYAKWTPVTVTATLNETEEEGAFTVSFNLNGASGTAPATQTVTATNGLVYPTIPTRSGYIFAGWYTTSSCTGTPYNFSATVSENKTLYAKWVSCANKALTLNRDNTINLTSSSVYYSFVPLTSGNVTISIGKNGYIHYSSSQHGYSSLTVSCNAGTLYTFYVESEYCNTGSAYTGSTYLRIANALPPSGGKSSVVHETEQLTYDDDGFTLTAPEREGCTFDGWYDGVGGTGTKYTDENGDAVRAWDKTQDTTLYPKWIADTYTLTLDNQGGTGSTSVTATYGEAMPRLTAPTKTGYTFTGYYDAVTGGTKYYNADMTSARSWNLDETATLYARWTATTYTITLNNQGGTGSSSVTATYGSSLPTLTAPTKAGHRFLGYFTATTGGTQYYSSTMVSQVTWNSTNPITLYARWEAIEYTITFNTNQGTGAQTAVTVTYGSNMSPITVAPTRPGYVFTGYYDAVTGGTKYYNADLSSAKTWDKEANTVLYAHWQANPYTVRFNANGGTGTMADQTFEYGTSENLNRNTFTRTGYTFAGWNTAANGTGTTYANAASVLNLTSVANATVTLYAKWTPVTVTVKLNDTGVITEYDVSFNLNGASGTAPATQTVTSTRGLTYPSIPTRSGYVFAGWYTNSACTGAPYNFSATVTDDITLYAKWRSYSGTGYVNYNSSSYLYAYSKSSSSTYYYAFVPLVSGTVTIYTNDSWDTYGYLYDSSKTLLESDDDDGESTNFSISYNVTAGTLYYIRVCGYNSSAYTTVYIRGASVPVGGRTANSYETETISYDEEFTLTVPQKEHYIFAGWYDGVGGTGTRYTDADGTSVRAWDKVQDTTLYAKWVAGSYDLPLNNQGGTGATSVTVTYGEAMPILTAPTKTGYTFAGYYDAVTGGTKYYNADMTSAKNCDIDETATLYARWIANTYTITLNNQGGTGSSSVTATYGSSLPTLTAPTKVGHRFLGYFTAATGGTQYYSSTMVSQVTWNSTNPITLYARWETVEYTVTFNTNQGTGAQTAVTVTYGSNMPSITVAPTKPGYIFSGYYDAVTGGTKYYNADLSSAKTWDKEANAVLYAHWQGYPYTVRFNANGGTGTMSNQTFEYGTSENLNRNTFTRTGYTFAGWNTAANGTGTTYANEASVLNLTSVANATVTLYATWTANNYEISLDDVNVVRDNITVTFNKNYSGSTLSTVTLNNGDRLSCPAKPTRSGYIFTGWYTTSSCTTKYNFSGNITRDMTLYAGWTTSGRTIMNNSSSPWSVSGRTLTSTNKSHSSSSEYRITASIPLVVSFSYKTASESNYDYLYIKKNGSTLKSCSGSTSYTSYSVSLNAGDYLSFIYSKDGSVSESSDAAYISGLTYTSNVTYTSTATAVCSEIAGYVYSEGSTHTINCDYDDSFSLPTPTRTGYIFAGWYDGVGGTGTRYTDAEGESVKTWDKARDTTLYAKWTPSVYNITYVLNGGTNNADNPATYTPDSDTITLKNPSKAGYSFIGWTTPTNSTPSMNYTINSGSIGNITLTANWIEYDVLDIEYNESIDYISVNTTPTADYFGATCLDTDNNEVDITVTYSGALISGQYVDVILTAQNNGKTSTTTIEDVKVYGTPTINIGKTTINSTDSINASTFEATAYDSFGVALNVTVELFEGSATGSGNKTYTFSATDRCGNIVRSNRSVRVYSANDITFNMTSASAIKATSTGEEFAVSATDTFGNACSIELVVQNGFALTAGNTISLYFEATDANGNKKTSNVISNVKVYGEPTIICRLPKITTQTNADEIFKIVDSFGVELDVTAQFVSTPVAGADVGVRLFAQDAAGNTINEEQTVRVICINHAISANCTCEICNEIVHTPGEYCNCLICGAVYHDLNNECYCENCSNYYHNFVSGECTVCEASENDVWNGSIATSYARGSGTSSDPYVIETSSQLAYLAQNVNNGNSYSGKYFILTNDLDLNNREWTPIGKGSLSDGDDFTTLAFSGNFNGNGHHISNCKINTTTYKRAGLFGALNGATVRYLDISDADIQISQQHIVCGGALAGTMKNTTISNCAVSGTVYVVDTSTGESHCACAGMFVGRLTGTSTIQNCSASGSVTGRMPNDWNAYVGGFVGSAADTESSPNLTISNCYFNGDVTAYGYDAGYAGGIIGISDGSTTISNCFAVTNITSSDYANAIAAPWSGYTPSISRTYYSSNASSSNGTSTSVSNFKNQSWLSTNLGWDFTNTWEITTGEYPRLKVFNN